MPQSFWEAKVTLPWKSKEEVVVATVNALLTVDFHRARMLYRRVASLAETINVRSASKKEPTVKKALTVATNPAVSIPVAVSGGRFHQSQPSCMLPYRSPATCRCSSTRF